LKSDKCSHKQNKGEESCRESGTPFNPGDTRADRHDGENNATAQTSSDKKATQKAESAQTQPNLGYRPASRINKTRLGILIGVIAIIAIVIVASVIGYNQMKSKGYTSDIEDLAGNTQNTDSIVTVGDRTQFTNETEVRTYLALHTFVNGSNILRFTNYGDVSNKLLINDETKSTDIDIQSFTATTAVITARDSNGGMTTYNLTVGQGMQDGTTGVMYAVR
jgi:hypothetical protein